MNKTNKIIIKFFLFSLQFCCSNFAPIMLNNNLTWMDDNSPMDIAALRSSKHMKRMLGRIQITGFLHHGHFTSDKEVGQLLNDPPKLLERFRLANKMAVPGNDHTELSMNRNRRLEHELFEGDILLTRPQAEQILREMENTPSSPSRRNARQLNPDTRTFWTDLTIPFTVIQASNDVLLQSVLAAHRHIASQTCIRFAYYADTTDLVGKRDYLEYYRQSGCWSLIGRAGGSQTVSIGYGCEILGIVVHETLHALGLWHEQSRTDQEMNIAVNYNNIQFGTESNFYKRTPDTSDNLGQPYDIGSVMHYSNKAFARDYNQFTITSIDPAYQYTMGYRGGMSFKDAKMINLHYCSKICPHELACANGGYTDPNNCYRCLCPGGYSGALCEELPGQGSQNCLSTGALMAGEYAGNISTVKLTPNTNCYWKILPESARQRVMITVKRLDFPCVETCTSYVEVKAKQDKVPTGARLCCAGIPSTIYADIGTEVVLILNVDPADKDGQYTGFALEYKSRQR